MKAKCTSCGRRARFVCPAEKQPLCPVCCAKNRGTQISCTDDCRRDPLSSVNYDRYLELDSKVSRHIIDQVMRTLGDKGYSEILRTLARAIHGAAPVPEDNQIAMAHCLLGWFDADGGRIIDRWAREGFPNMSADERRLLAFYRQAYPTITEVERVIDDSHVECLDVLAEKPFDLMDRSFARLQAKRFMRFLGYVLPLPHYYKFLGCTVLPEVYVGTATEAIVEAYEEYREDYPERTVHEFLGREFVRVHELVNDVGLRNRDRVLQSLDAKEHLSVYRIHGDPQEVIDTLNAKPDFEPQPEDEREDDVAGAAFNWLGLGESSEFSFSASLRVHQQTKEGLVPVIGTVWVDGSELRLRTVASEPHKFATQMLQRYFADRLELVDKQETDLLQKALGEDTDDEVAARPGRRAPSGIPPEAQAYLLIQGMQQHYQDFPDTSVPALGNMTPRQAAKDAQMRPKLIDLMKGHISKLDEMFQDLPSSFNLDWILRELGLHELL